MANLSLPPFQISRQNDIWLGGSPLDTVTLTSLLGRVQRVTTIEADNGSPLTKNSKIYTDQLDPNNGTTNTIRLYHYDDDPNNWEFCITCNNFYSTHLTYLCLTSSAYNGSVLPIGNYNYYNYIKFVYAENSVSEKHTLEYVDDTVKKYRNGFGQLPDEILSGKYKYLEIYIRVISGIDDAHRYVYAAIFMNNPYANAVNYSDYVDYLLDRYPNKNLRIRCNRRIIINTPQSVSGWNAVTWTLQSDDTYIDTTNYFNENQLFLMDISCETNRLDKYKYLMYVTPYKGNVRDNVSITTPVIRIQSDNTFPTKYNYCYFAPFNRYYYINDIVAVTDNIFDIYCECDVLMSFYEYIMNLQVIALRNEYNYNDALIDEKLPIETDVETIIVNNQTISNPCYGFGNSNVTGLYYILTLVTDTDMSENSVDNNISDTAATRVYYLMDYRALNIILSMAVGGDIGGIFSGDPSQNIISIKCLPIEISPSQTDYDVIGNGGHVQIGSTQFTMPDDRAFNLYRIKKGVDILSTILEQDYEFDFSSTGNSKFYSNYKFIDINYTTVTLYIPMIGTVNINTSRLYSDNLYKEFILKIHTYISLDGHCCCYIYKRKKFSGNPNVTNGIEILEVIEKDVGFEYPIGHSNMNDIKRNLLLGGLSIAAGFIPYVGGSISQGISTANTAKQSSYSFNRRNEGKKTFNKDGSLSKGFQRRLSDYTEELRYQSEENKADAVKRGTTFINHVANNTIGTLQKISLDQSFSFSMNAQYSDVVAMADMFRNYGCIMYIYRNKVIEQSNYAFNVGRPSDYSGSLFGLYGYTEIGTVHIENIPNLMASEANDLESILRGGIIMPPKPS